MLRTRFVLPIALLSVIAAIGLSIEWMREKNQVHRLVIAAGSKQGEYYNFAQALSTVVARHQPDIQITVLETEGAQQNIHLSRTATVSACHCAKRYATPAYHASSGFPVS